MRHKTAELQERNQELQVAYERGREDERTKTAFLSTISEKIMKPVNEIRTATDRLGWSYQDLTKAEMEQLQQQISTNSETITNLIDQTLITSSGEEKDMIEG
jgi:K+-sensing histidine kinase KdpD